MITPKCIFWDYNGTLIDDVSVALDSVNDMLIKRGMPVIDMEQYKSYIDVPISKFYEHIFDLNEVPFDVIAEEFALGYEKHIPEDPVMDGAKELLCYFANAGKFQAIISGSHKSSIETGLERFGLREYFDLVSGADDLRAGSKISRAESIAREHCRSSRDILVIGDCVQDYEVSRRLGANCVLLTAGHQSRADLETTGAVVVDSLCEIRKYVR